MSNLNLTASACQTSLQAFAANDVCFGQTGIPRLNASQLASLAAEVVPNLNNPLTLATAVLSAIARVGNDATANSFRSLCSRQTCVVNLADVLQNCFPFDNYREVLVLLVNFVTDFVCAQGPNNELCLEKLFQTNAVTPLGCVFTAIVTSTDCSSSCQTSVQGVSNDFGCCYNNLLDAFESTTGIDISSLRSIADRVWGYCEVESPGMCTTAVFNPLTSSPTGGGRAVSTAGFLMLLMTIFGVLCWRE